MPIYEYRCPDGHAFEVVQSMSDDPVTACEVCGKPVERVFHPIAVHFKGSGFYTTDYAKKGSPSPNDARLEVGVEAAPTRRLGEVGLEELGVEASKLGLERAPSSSGSSDSSA